MSENLTFLPVEIEIEIPAHKREALVAKVAKINRRLAKMGAPAATVEFGPVRRIEEKDEFGFTKIKELLDAKLVGHEAKIAGFRMVASLDHSLPGGNFISKAPAFHEIDLPTEFATVEARCDHCNLVRDRKITLVLLDEAGAYKMIGKSCAAEFFGIDPANALSVIWSVDKMAEGDEEDGGWGNATSIHAVEDFVGVAAHLCELVGFAKSGSIDAIPTRSAVRDILDRGTGDKVLRPILGRDIGKFDIARAKALGEEIMAWFPTAEMTGDYGHNMRIAVDAGVVVPRTEGILASLPVAWARATEKLAAKADADKADAVSEFVGAVGDKVVVTGSVVSSFTVDGFYGASRIVVVRDGDGNLFKTIGSGVSLFNTSAGETVELKGSIKGHEVYNGRKETVLTRVKIK